MHALLLIALPLLQTIALEGDTHHVQGIAVEGNTLWVTSVDRAAQKGFLSEYALDTGRRIRSVELQKGDTFHPGGFDQDEESLWIPVAEYRPNSHTLIQRRSKQTLELLSSFEVPDHIGCLAVLSSSLIAANWDARKFYTYSLDGKQQSVRNNPNLTRYQDIKYRDGAIIASGLYPKGRTGGAVEWLDPETFMPMRTESFALTDRGTPFNNEGMELRDNRLYLLPEDSHSRLFVFDLSQQ